MAEWKRYFEEIPWMPYPAMPGNHEHRFNKEQMMTNLTSATTEDLILELGQRMRPVTGQGKRQERRDVMDRIAKAVSIKVFQRLAHVMVDLQVRRATYKVDIVAKAYGGNITREMAAPRPFRKPRFDVMGHRRHHGGVDWAKDPDKTHGIVSMPDTGKLEIHRLEDILRPGPGCQLTTVLKL